MVGYMGRRPVPGLVQIGDRKINPKMPLEDPADGCPGSWVRCRFALSLVPYLRRRTENGGRVANPFLDATDDEFIWQLALYAEDESERHTLRMRES